MESLAKATELLDSYGPWALVVFLGVAVYVKDRQYRQLIDQLIGLVKDNVEASGKMEAAVTSLKDLIQALTAR